MGEQCEHAARGVGASDSSHAREVNDLPRPKTRVEPRRWAQVCLPPRPVALRIGARARQGGAQGRRRSPAPSGHMLRWEVRVRASGGVSPPHPVRVSGAARRA